MVWMTSMAPYEVKRVVKADRTGPPKLKVEGGPMDTNNIFKMRGFGRMLLVWILANKYAIKLGENKNTD